MILPKLTWVYDRRGQASKSNPATVELKVYLDRRQKYISTGVRLLPKEWANGEVSACNKDFVKLNKLLCTFKDKAFEIITAMAEQGNIDLNALPNLIKDSMTSEDTFINYAKGVAFRKYRELAEGTRKRYDVVFRFLEEWKGIVYFSDVTEKNILKMDDELVSRGLKENSRYNYHKILKVFVLQAYKEGLIAKNPYSVLKIKRGEDNGLTHYLTPDEFHRFEKVEIDDKCLAKVRDLFVFQTYTMMAYSDLADFRYKDCVKVDGQLVYKAARNKTKQMFVVVLLPQAKNILKKYKNKLPIICNQDYNRYLKAAVKYAKIKKNVTSHWARHTGATLMVNDGMPMHIVQHILGHASIRETEKTYAKVLDSTIVKGMASYGTKKGRG